MNIALGYDVSLIEPVGDVQRGPILDGFLFKSNAKERQVIYIGFARSSGVSGTGTLATIPFRLVGRAGASATVSVQVTTANQPDRSVPVIDVIHGGILILDEKGQTPGDVTGDDVVDELDASFALEMSVKLRPENLVVDMDKDGKVTSLDAMIILQSIRVR